MKQRFWLFKRGAVFYLQDSVTGKKESLATRDPKKAERIRLARNEVAEKPQLGLSLGKAYLSAYDPQMVERRWSQVMDEFSRRGRASSRLRYERAWKGPTFAGLRTRKIIETTADDLRAVLSDGRSSTNHFLRRLHNLALGLGWLPWPLIQPKMWPQLLYRRKRGITASEHATIIASEQNAERRAFYELLWEIGAAQSDAVALTAENIDWTRRVISYQRCKTGQWSHLIIGDRLEALLRQLPAQGPLFPSLQRTTVSGRSSEFCRRCRVAGVNGVSLHSYRYAWAERARSSGYPERWAQNALGHNSRAVHEAYARSAVAFCPPLEEYEKKTVPFPTPPRAQAEAAVSVQVSSGSSGIAN
jgi:integrase